MDSAKVDEPWADSPFMTTPEITTPPEVADCTLREGDQCAGIFLNRAVKVEAARLLDDLGVHEIELGMPAISRDEALTLEEVAKSTIRARLTALCRARKEDVDIASTSGAWGVVISLPAGELQIQHKLAWPHQKVIDTAIEIGQYAKGRGLHVTISPYDTVRSDPAFLSRYLESVATADAADRVRLVDTVGVATPHAIRRVMTAIQDACGLPVEIHCHNDFGLAIANTITAIEVGARVASTSFFGIGERAGNAPTEELIVALRVLYGVDMGMRYEALGEISERLAALLDWTPSPLKPIVGRNAFTQLSGMVVDGFLRNPLVAVPYLPELIGRRSEIAMGKGVGRSMVAWKLDQLGLSVPSDRLGELTQRIKEQAIEHGRLLGDAELTHLVNDMLTDT